MSSPNLDKPKFAQISQLEVNETLMTTRRETSSDENEGVASPNSPMTLYEKSHLNDKKFQLHSLINNTGQEKAVKTVCQSPF